MCTNDKITFKRLLMNWDEYILIGAFVFCLDCIFTPTLKMLLGLGVFYQLDLNCSSFWVVKVGL